MNYYKIPIIIDHNGIGDRANVEITNLRQEVEKKIKDAINPALIAYSASFIISLVTTIVVASSSFSLLAAVFTVATLAFGYQAFKFMLLTADPKIVVDALEGRFGKISDSESHSYSINVHSINSIAIFKAIVKSFKNE